MTNLIRKSTHLLCILNFKYFELCSPFSDHRIVAKFCKNSVQKILCFKLIMFIFKAIFQSNLPEYHEIKLDQFDMKPEQSNKLIVNIRKKSDKAGIDGNPGSLHPLHVSQPSYFLNSCHISYGQLSILFHKLFICFPFPETLSLFSIIYSSQDFPFKNFSLFEIFSLHALSPIIYFLY